MLKEYLLSIGIKEVEEKKEKFDLYENYLIEQNKLFNLTAITEKSEIEQKHFIDSLAAFPYVKGSVLDIGSGAGFPAVPLKIVLPQNDFTLIDSLQKRIDFLIRVFALLSLTDITAIHTRIEDFPKKEEFDTVVARAVAPLRTLCEYALPFVKIGGTFIAYKTLNEAFEKEKKEAENAMRILGGEITKVVPVPFDDVTHGLILIQKKKSSPSQYPRGKNKPKTQPL